MALTLGCERASTCPEPQITAVEPWFWDVDEPPGTPLAIAGDGFFGRVRTDATATLATNHRFAVEVGGAPLAPVRWIDNRSLEAGPPLELPIGIYDLAVTTPDGANAALTNAIEVLEPGTNPVGQRREGPAAIHADATETTVLIDPVDPSSSILFFNITHDSHEPGTGLVTGWLADDGRSVTFARNTTRLYDDPSQPAGESVSIRWSVLQIDGIRVQRDRLVFGAGLEEWVTLPSTVESSRSFVLATHNLDGGHFAGNDWVRARLESDQTVRLTFRQTAPLAVVAWQVIELPAGAVVEAGDSYLTGGATSTSVTTIAQPLANSLLLFTQNVHGSTQNADGASALVSGRLLSPTEISFERFVGWTQADVDISWFRITWSEMFVQHGVEPFAAAELTRDVAIPATVDRSRSVALLAGQMRQGRADQGDDHVGAGWFTTELKDAGATMRLTRGVADGSARAPWQVVEFQ